MASSPGGARCHARSFSEREAVNASLEHIEAPLFIIRSADTVVGVETLARPGYLIEVDAIAVIDR
jgi:enamine deaminase RidA (YjgF/YER057c/UK114 family)